MQTIYRVYMLEKKFDERDLRFFYEQGAGFTLNIGIEDNEEDVHDFDNETEARKFLNTTENSYYWGRRFGEAQEWFLKKMRIDEDGNELYDEYGNVFWDGDHEMADNADQIACDFLLDELKGGPCWQLEFSKDNENWESHWSIKEDHWESWQEYIARLDEDKLRDALAEMEEKGFTKYRIIRWHKKKMSSPFEKEIEKNLTREEIEKEIW